MGINMDDYSVKRIRSEAARVGYLGESPQKLKDLVDSRIKARIDKSAERLSLKRAKAARKLESVKKRLHRHYAKYGMPIQCSELQAGAFCLFLGIVLLSIGSRLPDYLLLAPLLYGVAGTLLIKYTGIADSLGEHLIVSLFVLISALTVMLVQWLVGSPWQVTVISVVTTGTAVYLMNLIILSAVAATFQQISIIVGNCRKWILEYSGKYWTFRHNKLHNRYETLIERKRTERAKLLAMIECEALMGRLAKSERNKKKMKSVVPSIVEKEFRYVE